jgi:L-fuculose-phosphate aldolase
MSHQPESHIIQICQRLYQKNLLAAADGNVSIKVSENEILITPSGLHKGFITEADLARITLDGQVISGNPSSEKLMHLEIYKSCPQAKAVVHAHPPTAIAWSVAFPELTELPADCLSEVILAVGRIPMVPYARPGTQEMGTALRNFLPNHRVMILSRHGALAWGEDLVEAFYGMERLEHVAGILKSAVEMAGPKLSLLDVDEIEYLKELRKKLGPRSL